MFHKRFGAALSAVALLSACSGGGGGSVAAPPVGGGGGSTPAPTAGCSLRERQDWAAAQLNEWYLFPSQLATGVNPASYSTVEDYIDALTAPARAARQDRYFTHIASIAEENAYYASGSSAGFGFRLAIDSGARRLFSAETFENTPALSAGIDRGTEILAIGTSSATLRDVSAIMASEGSAGITNALGPAQVGLTRVMRVTDAAGTRVVTMAKAEYDLTPVSSRYGMQILADGARRVGYLNLRTFINTSDPALRNAFAQFRAQGITEIIIDLRYNGGGLVSIAELMGNLLGRDRSTSDVLGYLTFRPSKSAENDVTYFAPQPQSVAPTRLAFIGTEGTASASELVINAFIPYLGNRSALIGTDTYGKPVGQIAIDKASCDDRLRVVAFAVENRDHQGAYYDGLAATMGATCQAGDDIFRPMGDPLEASTRAALDFLAGRSCSAIASGGQGAQALSPARRRELLTPARPTTAQRDVPGLF